MKKTSSQMSKNENNPALETLSYNYNNSIFSDWILVEFSKGGGREGIELFFATIEIPELTKDILNHGEVSVYMRSSIDPLRVHKLPLIYTYQIPNSQIFTNNTDFILEEGVLIINSFGYIKGNYFRYVIKPGRLTPFPISPQNNNIENS